MLGNKDYVKDNADIAEQQLDRVAGEAGPVCLKGRVDDYLSDRKNPADDVEQDRPDRPSDRGFSLVIDIYLSIA